MKKIKFITTCLFVLYSSINVFNVVNPKAFEIKTYDYNNLWKYSEYSKLNNDSVKLYCVPKYQANYKNKTVCINAGHGSSKGPLFEVFCHPDGSPKLISGSTKKGCKFAKSITIGTILNDGTREGDANLHLAFIVRNKLLENGYNVLMIRETCDCNLDNIARAVFANNLADCHIALHYDSSSTDKGAFYLSIPGDTNYKKMPPVRDNWQKHELLGQSIINGLKSQKVKICNSGRVAMDLVQTSYSTIPSIDLEVGDKATNRSEEFCNNVANGIVVGLNEFRGWKIKYSKCGQRKPKHISLRNYSKRLYIKNL